MARNFEETCRVHLQNFCTYAAIHGAWYVNCGYKGVHVRRLALLAILIGLFGSGYYQYILMYEVFVLKPNIVDQQYIRESTLRFPNIILCDMNTEQDKIDTVANAIVTNGSRLYSYWGTVTYNQMFTNIRTELRESVNDTFDRWPELESIYQFIRARDKPPLEIMETFGMYASLEETFRRSKSEYEQTGYENNSREVLDPTLDSQIDIDDLQVMFLPSRNELIKGKNCLTDEYWKDEVTLYSLCQKFTPPPGEESVELEGAFDGLHLILDHELWNAAPFSAEDVYVMVFLHEPDTPFSVWTMTNRAQSRPGGSFTFLLEKKVFLDESGGTDCIRENATGHLFAYPGYSFDLCKDECVTNRISDACGCVTMVYRELNYDLPVCGIGHTLWCDPPQTKLHEECNLQCISQCGWTRFEISQKVAQFPSDGVHSHLLAFGQNYSHAYMEENFSEVKIGFSDLKTERTVIQRKYEFFTIVSALGGLFGVFIGCSMVTLLEIIGFFTGFYYVQ